MLPLILAIIVSEYSFAQDYECGTVASKEIIEKSVADRKKRSNNSHKSIQTLYVKVQPHIIQSTSGSGGLTNTQLTTAMQGLQDRYNSANIVFDICPAQYINNGGYHSQLIKDSPEFNTMYNNAATVADAVNVFFAENPRNIDNTKVVNGWATFPDDYPDKNWVVVRNGTFNNGSTLAHEMGHYFGLYHTHEDLEGTSIENATRNVFDPCWNCTYTGDTFCDTEADTNLNKLVDTSCNYSSLGSDVCGVAYVPDATNVMSYSRRTCRTNFSYSQQQELRDMRVSRSYISNYCTNPTCNDGIQNQDETDIDCGGICLDCETCSDNIRNQGETGEDCGGSCDACPTCFDGIRNQDETGIDCGGTSCPACPPPGCNLLDGYVDGNPTGNHEVENYIISPSPGGI